MALPALPPITVSPQAPEDADVLVLGLADASGSPMLLGMDEVAAAYFEERFGTDLLDVAQGLGASSKVGTAIVLPSAAARVIVTGVGDVDVTPEQVRRAAGAALRVAAALPGPAKLSIALSLDVVDPESIKGAAEGALLAAHTPYPAKKDAPAGIGRITVVAPDTRDAKRAVEMAAIVAAGVCEARDWVNRPANFLYPETFAEDAKALARESKLEIEVLDEKALEKGGYGGLLAVGGGSVHPPRLARISYHPRGVKNHLVLVGKGITFDSGGLDIKPADAMYNMKSDMAGAAAVLAAVRAIARLKLKVRVTAYAAMAENMPSGTAYRPSDVLTIYGGTTVENANTDAEGRLVLADALVRAREDSADLVVDIATLTGACIVALGNKTAGLMASDDATADHVLDAAEVAGEAFWQLPITDEVREHLRSDVADVRSSGTSRYGGALTAAAFLQRFVGEDTAWAHLDIAGPSFNEAAAYEYVAKGGTGAGVRTLVALAASLQG